MEREYRNYQSEELTLPKLVPLREPFHEIKINSMYDKEVVSEAKTHLTYTLEYDIDAYQKLRVFKDTDSERYIREKEALDGLTKFNMMTLLGERLNASISERIDVVDEQGIMRDRFQNKALIDWYEAGRIARFEDGSSVHDQLREAAEVEGQRTIQERLRTIGKMMVSVSPPGGIYKHNFYDVFKRVSQTEIEVVRYMSGLTIPETMARLRALGIQTPSDDVTDVELLANPFEIEEGQTPCKTPDDIHAFLHTHIENSLSREEMSIVKNECQPLINRYLMVVENAPYATDTLKQAYKAVVNKADEVVEKLKAEVYDLISQPDKSSDIAPLATMLALGSQPVRAVDTGCGFSAGFAFGGSSAPFGVLDFAPGFYRADERDQYESLYFICPSSGCRKENKRPRGILIPNCQHCGADVSCGPDKSAEKKKKEKLRQEEEQREQKRLEEASVLEKKKKEKQKKKDEEGGFLLFLFQPKEEKEAA